MRCFRIETLGDRKDKTLAFIDTPPKNIGVFDYYISEGERIGEHYPANATIYLQAKHPGIKLASFIGNTLCFLIVHTSLKDVFLDHVPNGIEPLPFTLYNHKKRVHSRDYWIINPLGVVDCLDREHSEIVYFDEDPSQIITVRKFVFDARKLEDQPALFRVPEARTEYFMTLPLARSIKQGGFTNVQVSEIEVRNGADQ